MCSQSLNLLVPQCKTRRMAQSVKHCLYHFNLMSAEGGRVPTHPHSWLGFTHHSYRIRIHLANILVMFAGCKFLCRWYFELDCPPTLWNLRLCWWRNDEELLWKTGRGGTIFATLGLRRSLIHTHGVDQKTPRKTAWFNGFKKFTLIVAISKLHRISKLHTYDLYENIYIYIYIIYSCHICIYHCHVSSN